MTHSVPTRRSSDLMTLAAAPWLRHLLWMATVAAAAYFFAWAETYFYVASSDLSRANVWYVDIPRMLSLGSACYALYFIVSRSEEHTSELQSLMRISYAVFCLKTKTKTTKHI